MIGHWRVGLSVTWQKTPAINHTRSSSVFPNRLLLHTFFLHKTTQTMHSKQGVALTGRNTTGPLCSVTVELWLDWSRAAWRRCLACTGEAACRPAVECYRRRRQMPATVYYTMCKQASNNKTLCNETSHYSWLNCAIKIICLCAIAFVDNDATVKSSVED